MLSSSLEIRLRDFWLIVFPILVFVFGDLTLDLISNSQISYAFSTSAANYVQESTNRYLFFASEIAFVMSAIGVFCYFIFDIGRTFNRESRYIIYWAYILSGIMMTSVIWRPKFTGLPDRTYWLLGKKYFEDALRAVKFDFINQYSMYDVFNITLKLMNVCAFLSVPALIVGCISSLGRLKINQDFFNNTMVLGVQAERLKTYLYLTSYLLVLVIVQLIFWMQWPSFALRDQQLSDYNALVRSISSYYGVNYVLLACAYYIPACIVLTRRIHNQAKLAIVDKKEELTVKSIRQWESKMGLVVIDLKSYKVMAAILSPLFPGLLGGVLNAFGGGK